MDSTAENSEFFQRSILAVDSVPVWVSTNVCQTGTSWERIHTFAFGRLVCAPNLYPYDARCVISMNK
jgi:hypothetical protein